MTNHPYEDIEAFALGELDELSSRRLLEHADACPACAVLVAQAGSGVAALALTEPQAEPRADLRRRIAKSVRSRSAFGPSSWIAGAAVAACLVLAVWNVNLRNSTAIVPVDALVHSHFAHHALAGGPGSAKVLLALDGSWVYVVADGLQPRVAYAVSETRGDRSVRLGSLIAGADGRGTAFWRQSAGPVSSVLMEGPGDATLRWP